MMKRRDFLKAAGAVALTGLPGAQVPVAGGAGGMPALRGGQVAWSLGAPLMVTINVGALRADTAARVILANEAILKQAFGVRA